MIVDHGTIHTGAYVGQRWEIVRRNIRGAAAYVLTVGDGEFTASGDTVRELLDELEEI